MSDENAVPLTATNIRSSYGKEEVLKGINISVGKDTIFALLGPNGAGKTTFIRSILNLLPLDAGEVMIYGHQHTLSQIHFELAYLPEKFNWFPFYTVENFLQFYAEIVGVVKEEQKERIDLTLEELGLTKYKKTKMKKLSKGQVQRVGWGPLLLSDANLWLLDEPFNGLDPIVLRQMKKFLLDQRSKGKTIFLNSHILMEIEELVDDLAIINHGTCLVQGELQQLTKGVRLTEYFADIIDENDREIESQK